MHHRTLHRALLLGALAASAWTATELADNNAAHADAPPAVTIDRPGGLVDRATKLPHRLPQQASARAKQVVAKATAEPTPAEPTPKPKPCEDQADEPSTPAEPEPAPSDKPEDKPAQDKPRNEPTPPVEAPPADEPPVESPPAELPPAPPAETPLPPLPPVEVPPLPSPPPVELPAPAPPVELPPAPRTDPLPAPPADVPPLPAPAPVVAPGPLPATIDAAPAAMPPAGGVVDQLIAELAAGETTQPICADDPDDARHIDRDALRALLAGLDHKPTATASDRNPCRPQMPAVNNTGAGQVKPPPPSAGELIVAVFTGSHVPPALDRLEHTRARSHLPAGRSPHIEPSPA